MINFAVGLAGILLILVQWPFRKIADALDGPIDRLGFYADRQLEIRNVRKGRQ